MALNIKGGDCDDPVQPSACTVGVGDAFTLSVDAISIPSAGYILAQTFIDYGPSLTYKPLPEADEIVWPDLYAPSAIRAEPGTGLVQHGGLTSIGPPFPASTFVGNLVEMQMNCTPGTSITEIELLGYGHPLAGTSGALFIDGNSVFVDVVVGNLTVNCAVATATPTDTPIDTPTFTPTTTPTPTPTPEGPTPTSTKQPEPGDTDGDGCSDQRENGPDETLGGLRGFKNPWDFYDVLGPGAALPIDGIIDLPNDILGVIQRFSPSGASPYDVQFDRGVSSGPNPWNMTAPDGVIDLPNDILGVILQFNHRCV